MSDSRRAIADPENTYAKISAENKRRREQGEAFWGGYDIAGKYVFIEGAIYHFFGKVESIQHGVVWLTDAHKALDNDAETITRSEKVGRISIPTNTVMMLGLKGEVAWYK